MITIGDVEAAASRIKGSIRRTPVIEATQLLDPPVTNRLWLKLESLQVTGSFKARGATNRLLTSDPATLRHGIVTASGGNHGLAVARAGGIAGVPTTVYLPATASRIKIDKLAKWGADIRIVGDVWDESDKAARRHAEETGAVYFHPFADPAIVAGQGTVALEILEDIPSADVYVIAVGGGGLIAGMSTVIKALHPSARIIGVEPYGSPTIHDSLKAGRAVRLPQVTTQVATMACGRTDDRIYELLAGAVESVALVEDAEMLAASRWLWFELGLGADLSAAAAIAALRNGRVTLDPGETVCTLVCGAGDEGVLPAA
jgi:threonine dehydratase